jgi:Glycosyl transferase family 2
MDPARRVERRGPRLVSHINGDGDLLQAWLDYYLEHGVSSFHFIVHGPHADNESLFALKASYPIVIEETYEGDFSSEEKRRRLCSLLARMKDQWIVLVDSDEFVEFPYAQISVMIRALKLLRANALYAPMVQRMSRDGSLDSPPIVRDPFLTFPLCSVDLYRRMGVEASMSKYPLFWCGDFTAISEGGNHYPPNGERTVLCRFLQGVTHHFKWRRTVLKRLALRARSSHTFRHESVGFQAYLEEHGRRLPLEGAFPYARAELLRRGLVRTLTPRSIGYQALRHARRWAS